MILKAVTARRRDIYLDDRLIGTFVARHKAEFVRNKFGILAYKRRKVYEAVLVTGEALSTSKIGQLIVWLERATSQNVASENTTRRDVESNDPDAIDPCFPESTLS